MKKNKYKKVSVYTGGVTSADPGPGGWSFVVINDLDDVVNMGYGSEQSTSKNRMEIMGAYSGVKDAIEMGIEEINVYSDSAYVVDTMSNRWWIDWISNGWIASTGQPIKNKDLWLSMLNMLNGNTANVQWNHVKDYSSNKWNEEVDKLAKSAAPRRKNEENN